MHARQAYLDAVRERASTYGYAAGTRPVSADIDHLREAEDRRVSSEPSTTRYHEAARDVQDRALRIVTQVVEDEALAERPTRQGDANAAD